MEELEVVERKLGEVYHILSNVEFENPRVRLVALSLACQVLRVQKLVSELRRKMEVLARGH